MAQVTTLGVDIAKNGVCVHGIDTQGHVIVREAAGRAEGTALCGPAAAMSHWHGSLGRCRSLGTRVYQTGHTVKLMSPQFVKPYVQSQKNDPNHAAGIWRGGRTAQDAWGTGEWVAQ